MQFFSAFPSLVAQLAKDLPAMQETWVRSLEEGMATHSSVLAWRAPMDIEPGGLQPIGSQRVGHDRVTRHTNTQHRDTLEMLCAYFFWLSEPL